MYQACVVVNVKTGGMFLRITQKVESVCCPHPWAVLTLPSGTFHKMLLPKCPVLPQKGTGPLHTGQLVATERVRRIPGVMMSSS